MKVENGKVYNAGMALKELLSKEWPVKLSLTLIKLSQELDTVFNRIDVVRLNLVNKYGERKEGSSTKNVTPESENWKLFTKDYEELMIEESEIEFTKVILPLSINGKDINLKPNVILALENFVEFREK